VGEPKVK